MSSVQIPRHVHEQEMEKLREEYTRRVGPINGTIHSEVTREQFVQRYSHALAFWNDSLPDIDLTGVIRPTMETIARHALCTNARLNILRHASEKGVSEEELLTHVARDRDDDDPV